MPKVPHPFRSRALASSALALAMWLSATSAAMAGAPSRPGAVFPSSADAGAKLSVTVAIPRQLLTSRLSLQQFERPRWKPRVQLQARRVGFITLSFSAPQTSVTLLLRIQAMRSNHLLWGSRVVQVAVHGPPAATSTLPPLQTMPTPQGMAPT
ncbi:MAG: hypothetical protein ACRDK2_16530, partial [Solirubrobacteraceae bacterium]